MFVVVLLAVSVVGEPTEVAQIRGNGRGHGIWKRFRGDATASDIFLSKVWHRQRRDTKSGVGVLINDIAVYEASHHNFSRLFSSVTLKPITSSELRDVTSQRALSALVEVYDAIHFLHRYLKSNKGIGVQIVLAETRVPYLLGQAYTTNGNAVLFLFLNHLQSGAVFETMVHELLHGLGFGTTDRWKTFIDNRTFVGPTAVSIASELNIGPLILDYDSMSGSNTLNHWSKENELKGEVMNAWMDDFFLHPVTVGAIKDADDMWIVSLCESAEYSCDAGQHCTRSAVGPAYCTSTPPRVYTVSTYPLLHGFAAVAGTLIYIALFLKAHRNEYPTSNIFTEMES